MKNKDTYLREVESRLAKMFRASRDGHKASPVERHRLEGFIQAGIFLDFASAQEFQSLMDRVHLSIFGKTVAERQSEHATAWVPEGIDYSLYDQPAYERSNH